MDIASSLLYFVECFAGGKDAEKEEEGRVVF